MTEAAFISANDITFLARDLPVSIRGFCFHDDEGRYIVVVNSRLDRQMNKRTAKHELRHIMRGDNDNLNYAEYE